ncbi:MAG: FAD-dependent oxidoreductase [Phycisphaeraceae bacterium]|nr:FAD-dependent oxidoreductase [Phycisphaeraceae bacterium]
MIAPHGHAKAPPRRVIVIGAGIVGLSCAWWLRREGVEVTVLDRDDPDESASAGNAGLLSIGHYPINRPGVAWKGLRWMASRRSPLYIRPTVDRSVLSWLWSFHRHCNAAWCDRCLAALCALGFPALEAFEAIMADAAIECDYARDGWLDVALTPAGLRQAESDARVVERFGYTCEVLEGAALRAKHPIFRDEVAGAVLNCDSARIHPGRFIEGLMAALRRGGCTVRIDAAVESLLATQSLERGNDLTSVHGVRLVGGEVIEADAVIVAAGAWSAALVEPIGVRLPLMAARGYHLHFDRVPQAPGTGCVLGETKVAVTPMGASLRLAGTLEIGPTGRPWMRERIDAIVDGAARYMHGVRTWSEAREWAGYRPCLPDGMPAVGAVPWARGVIIATGHAMMGMTLGPVSGRLAADLLLGRSPSIDVSMLAADRFGRLTPRAGARRDASASAR